MSLAFQGEINDTKKESIAQRDKQIEEPNRNMYKSKRCVAITACYSY